MKNTEYLDIVNLFDTLELQANGIPTTITTLHLDDETQINQTETQEEFSSPTDKIESLDLDEVEKPCEEDLRFVATSDLLKYKDKWLSNEKTAGYRTTNGNYGELYTSSRLVQMQNSWQ
jgi:hypothetical protein